MALLEVERVSKRFGGLQAVNGASFTVEEGSVVSLIGPNGAGKTTLFNLVSGFLRPDAGDIRFQGRSIVGLRPHSICEMGLVRTFQLVKPFRHLSVLENVMVGAYHRVRNPAAAADRARAALAFVGLLERAGMRAADLTTSEQRRLEVARCLATGPRLLLLDEVMAGLNPTEVDGMIGLVRRIAAAGVTVLLIEHVMRAVMAISERVVVLHHGEIIAQGLPQEIVRHPKVVEAYLGEEAMLA